MARQAQLVLVLALCAISVAMVMKRRSLPEDEVTVKANPQSTTKEPDICDEHTACLWSVYVRFVRTLDYNITNTCVCDSGKTCKYYYDNISINAYEYRCMTS